MRTRPGTTRAKVLTVAAAATSALMLTAGPALAAHDDSFTVNTTDNCGAAEYVDYGSGSAGGGDNDDYIVIHDYCSDGYGVKAWLWWYDSYGNTILGNVAGYDGNGLAGAPFVWDPFKAYGNVLAGDKVAIKVCLVNGINASTGSHCRSDSGVSEDG